MSAELSKQNHKIPFVKMNGAGNDFVIFDARKNPVTLTSQQIKEISNRKNIGCDQLIILKNADEANCLMEIYNSDGSLSGACGNATRCVASILFSESTNSSIVKIKTAAGILKCWREKNLIAVDMGVPTFEKEKILLHGFEFHCVDVGNPHAVTFITQPLSDEEFFKVGPSVETNSYFPKKTNVEFARILSDNLIEVRVWERGAGETLACGSGACAVGILAIKNNLVVGNKVVTRFKGGDLEIQWNKNSVVMIGGYEKEFEGEI
jgi:diaminopimelate epimerase